MPEKVLGTEVLRLVGSVMQNDQNVSSEPMVCNLCRLIWKTYPELKMKLRVGFLETYNDFK